MNRFYKHFFLSTRVLLLPPIVLVLELHTPVCEKPCLRKLQLLSSQLSLEPPESNSPPQCQSCACVLAVGVAAVCNSTTYTDLPQRAGLGLSATYGLDSSYASFGERCTTN